MASCKNDFICTLLMQFFYSFLSVQLIWKNFAPGRSPPTSKFMRDCLCLACVQTYPISSVATKVIGDACTQASRGPTPTAHDCSFKSKRWPQDQVQPGLSTRLQGSMLFEGRVRLYTGYRITSTTGIRAQMVTKKPASLFHLLII